jgi:hypothetical protein
LNFDDCESGAELRELLRFVFLLLVDRREGVLDDFVDERRSGITTTGMAPLFMISRRDLLLEVVVVLTFPVEARLWCLRSGNLADG